MTFLIHISTVLEKNRKILLVKEGKANNYGKWNLPGGHLELSERFCDAACREILEETGLHITLNRMVGIYTTWSHKHYVHFVYAGDVTGGKLTPQKGEILDINWFSREEIARMDESSLLNPQRLATILSDYQSGVGAPVGFIRENE